MRAHYDFATINATMGSISGTTTLTITSSSNAGGLVAYYPFNGNANDESGNGNNGTVSGATLTLDRTGSASSAYTFDGSNDDIFIANSNSLVFGTGDFTIGAWIYGKSWNTAGYNLMNIISKHAGTGDSGSWLFKVDKQASGLGKACFDFLDNSGGGHQNIECSTTELSINTWYHVAVTRAGSTLTIYVNGVANGTYSNSINLLSTSSIYIATQGNVGNERFNGNIDEVRLYNSALSASEMQALYGSASTNGLVAHYPFSGNANDASGNGNNGTVSGATLTIDRTGSANNAYIFDGSNDDIFIANSNSLVFGTGDFTIGAWIYGKSWNTAGYNLMNIISKHAGTGDSGSWLFKVDKQASGLGKACFDFLDNSGGGHQNIECSTTELSINTWYHVAVTRAGSTLTIYVNGVANGTYSNSINLLSISSIYIATQGNVGNERFNGNIDEVRLYNRALSASEIQEL